MSNTLKMQPPYSQEIEGIVLSAFLYDFSVTFSYIALLTPDDFYIAFNRLIFANIQRLAADGKEVSVTSVAEEIGKKDKQAVFGYAKTLHESYFLYSNSLNIDYNVKRLIDYRKAREYLRVGKEILSIAENFSETTDIVDLAANALLKLTEVKEAHQSELKALDLVLDEAFLEMCDKKAVTGLATGFEKLDKLTTGLHPGQLIIIAGRPGWGKTALALNVALHIAEAGKNVAIFSLEMKDKEFAKRFITTKSGIPHKEINQNRVEGGEAVTKLRSLSIFLDDTTYITPSEIMGKCKKLKYKKNLDLVVVDYIQLLSSGEKKHNRNLEVGDISRALKVLAMELDIPVIALSQLNRDIDKRAHQKPVLSDLRDSGSLEQDADVILFLHPQKKEAQAPDDALGGTPTDIIIAKQRNGPLGIVKTVFFKRIMKFE